jgi:hypothetical protein
MFIRLFAPQEYLQSTILLAVCVGCRFSFMVYGVSDPYVLSGYCCPHRRVLLDRRTSPSHLQCRNRLARRLETLDISHDR